VKYKSLLPHTTDEDDKVYTVYNPDGRTCSHRHNSTQRAELCLSKLEDHKGFLVGLIKRGKVCTIDGVPIKGPLGPVWHLVGANAGLAGRVSSTREPTPCPPPTFDD